MIRRSLARSCPAFFFPQALRCRNRLLRGELLEPCTCSAAAASSSSGMGLPTAPVNAAPTVAQAISINGNAAVTGKSASLSVLGSDDHGESNLPYTWSVTTAPVRRNGSLQRQRHQCGQE